MEKLALNVGEFAEMIGVSKPTAYNIVNAERFPKIRVGRRILIPVVGLEQWLEEQSGRGSGNENC